MELQMLKEIDQSRQNMPKRASSTIPVTGKKKRVRFTYSTPDQPALQRVVIQAIEKMGGQRKLKKLYAQHQKSVAAGENFFSAALRLLKMNVEVGGRDHIMIRKEHDHIFKLQLAIR